MADRSDSLKLYEDQQPQEVTTADILRRYGPEPDERGMLLPISRTGGKLSLDWPSAIYEPYQAIKRLVTRPVAPGYLSSSGDRGPIEDSFNAAAAVAAPSLGLNYAGMAPKNAVGIFGGRLAKTADQTALARAEEMATKGADRRAIWDETGWFQGKDGKWRFEIDDSKSALNLYPNTPQQAYDEVAHRAFVDQHPFDVERRKAIEPLKGLTTDEVMAQWKERAAPIIEAAQRGDKEAAMRASDARQPWDLMLSEMGQRKYGPMGAYLEHPELFRAYPAANDLHTRIDPYLDSLGHYFPGSKSQGEHVAMRDKPSFDRDRGVLLHELQHKIQRDENFARGDSPTHYPANRLKDEAIKPLDEQIQALMQEYPEAAEAYRARNRLQATLRGKEWSQADMAAMDTLEEKLFSLPGGKNLDRLDWERQSLWYQPEDYWKGVATNRYERAAGEVEARNVQKRMNMTPEERRATPPWETQDVPDTQQILRMYGEGPQMSQSLPMDEASRLARAREMGFDTERPMYHGSKTEFDSFLPSDRGAFGPGVYLTQHAGIARNYGPNVGEFYAAGNILNTGPFKPIPDGLAEQAKALLTPDEVARWNRLWPTPRDMGGYTIGNADAEVFREVLTRSVEPKRVPEIMKKLGYDGMEGVADGHEMVVFDPSKIRSTRAAFDPAKKDSGNLLASSAPTDPLTTQAILRQYGKDEE